MDDSLFMREFISSAIMKDPGIEVVGKASDPYDARDKIIELTPDVITLDVEMPKMNGIEFLKRLMPQYPLPVIVVSSVSDSVFDALGVGAVDFVNKADLNNKNSREFFISELIVKIKIASIAKVGMYKDFSKAKSAKKPEKIDKKNSIIAIGASTGGTEAIYDILKGLNRDLPGIVVVQHMPAGFTKMYAQRLNNACRLEVKEAEDGDMVAEGRALIAPGDHQLCVEKKNTKYIVKCFKGEKVNGHCPSVDVLFFSVADAAKADALGIILTGMGNDGAKGLLAMKNQGAATIGQNMASSVVYGMPKVAHDMGAVEKVLPLDEISAGIYNWYHR